MSRAETRIISNYLRVSYPGILQSMVAALNGKSVGVGYVGGLEMHGRFDWPLLLASLGPRIV